MVHRSVRAQIVDDKVPVIFAVEIVRSTLLRAVAAVRVLALDGRCLTLFHCVTAGGRAGGRGGAIMIVHAVVVRLLNSHPFKVGTEHAGLRPDLAHNHQARSCVMCSASRMEE